MILGYTLLFLIGLYWVCVFVAAGTADEEMVAKPWQVWVVALLFESFMVGFSVIVVTPLVLFFPIQ